jgi:hypothetical protein
MFLGLSCSKCCSDKCQQIDVLSQSNDWPGLQIAISGNIIKYGTYDGVPDGFWQGRAETGTNPSAVTLTFSDKKPAKIVVLCSAMNTGETQSYEVNGSALSAVVDGVRPSGAYQEGQRNASSGTISRADGGEGNSRFRLTIEESSPGSLTGFVWRHSTTSNANGMVNAIFLCDDINETVTFV